MMSSGIQNANTRLIPSPNYPRTRDARPSYLPPQTPPHYHLHAEKINRGKRKMEEKIVGPPHPDRILGPCGLIREEIIPRQYSDMVGEAIVAPGASYEVCPEMGGLRAWRGREIGRDRPPRLRVNHRSPRSPKLHGCDAVVRGLPMPLPWLYHPLGINRQPWALGPGSHLARRRR